MNERDTFYTFKGSHKETQSDAPLVARHQAVKAVIRSTTARPIGIEAVAAGEGALQTWIER